MYTVKTHDRVYQVTVHDRRHTKIVALTLLYLVKYGIRSYTSTLGFTIKLIATKL